MKKVIYYIVLAILVIAVLVAVPAILDLVFNIDLDKPGVKGLTAGFGIAVLASRNILFAWFDKLSKR